MTRQLTNAELLCLRSLLQAAGELGIPIFAVGASARWLVFNLPNEIPLHRTTTDWDFGVCVLDWGRFRGLSAKLKEQPDSFRQGRYEHELIHVATGTRIDLVPFGGLENEGRITWPDSELEMNVFGFSDAFENAIRVDIAPEVVLRVATVPLLVALKFFAFSDRKYRDNRDLSDLWHVVHNYPSEGREPEIFEQPLSSIIDEHFEGEYAGALLLGLDIGRACKPATRARLFPIVQELCDPYSDGIYGLISKSGSAEWEETQRRRVSASFAWLMKGIQVAP